MTSITGVAGDTDFIGAIFERFDVALLEDELHSRGVGPAEIMKLVTHGSGYLRKFALSKNWDLEKLYNAVEDRHSLKTEKKISQPIPIAEKKVLKQRRRAQKVDETDEQD